MADTLALHAIDEQIADAYSELLQARHECDHSPNADSLLVEEYADLRMNRLLERRLTAGK